jgi:hypothetical protein
MKTQEKDKERNDGSGETEFITEWDSFVLNHTKTGNHVFHLISSLCFFGGPIAALVTRNPYFLIAFFGSGLIGTFGHFVFKDGLVSVRDATVRHRVPLYVLRMFYQIAIGRYSTTVAEARRRAGLERAPALRAL